MHVAGHLDASSIRAPPPFVGTIQIEIQQPQDDPDPGVAEKFGHLARHAKMTGCSTSTLDELESAVTASMDSESRLTAACL